MNKLNVTRSKSLAGIIAFALAGSVSILAEAANAESPNVDGRWAATMTQKGGTVIPFRLDITGNGDRIVGTLHNGGADVENTTSASIENGNSERSP